MSQKFRLDRKIGFQNTFYTKCINVIIDSIGPSIILRSIYLSCISIPKDWFHGTVVPAKSDSDVMFVYKVIRDLESIDHLCINPIRRIGLILK